MAAIGIAAWLAGDSGDFAMDAGINATAVAAGAGSMLAARAQKAPA